MHCIFGPGKITSKTSAIQRREKRGGGESKGHQTSSPPPLLLHTSIHFIFVSQHFVAELNINFPVLNMYAMVGWCKKVGTK